MSGDAAAGPRAQATSRLLRGLPSLLWHLAGVAAVLWLSYQFRFDFMVPERFQPMLRASLPAALLSYALSYVLLGLHTGLWTYYGMSDLMRTARAALVGTLIFALVLFIALGFSFEGSPRSIFPQMLILVFLWDAGGRGMLRVWATRARRPDADSPGKTLLIARVEDANLLLHSAGILRGETGRIAGILTDEQDKTGATLQGVPILGPPDRAAELAARLGACHFLVLPPFDSPPALNRLVRACADARIPCQMRTVPSIAEVASGRVAINTIRRVDIMDLLPRPAQSFDLSRVRERIQGKTILVTGAGGSIGSELCRQIAALAPARLILLEHSEFALYTIHLELSSTHPGLRLEAFAGDIRLPQDCERALTAFGPVDAVYHAAAYKHVHLMEINLPAAFHNNVIGTAQLAEAAERHGVRDFLLISSDKAVRPASIMGATKRLAERVLMDRPRSATRFRAVRFGNVMDSSGSVIPLFKRQIAARGPVTVTTPETRRYFMTIPEAVGLVLMAGSTGADRDILLLEMGEPVRILDLAEKLIELSGFVPHQDIPIVFTGLRPGEKESEELITDGENATPTELNRIWVLNRDGETSPPRVDLDEVRAAIEAGTAEAFAPLLARWIPESPVFRN